MQRREWRRLKAAAWLFSLSLQFPGLVVGAAQRSFPAPRSEIRHIIPWGAGGATDAAMRGFMQYFEKHLAVPVVTENIPGGLSAVGLLRVKTAPPDGYTLGTMTYDVLTLKFQGLAPIDWTDFELIGMVTEHPSALIVAADRFESLERFREEAGLRPGAIKVGNAGTGGIWHQHAAAMERALGVRLVHVPYEAGSGSQLTALLGGEIDASVSSLPAALPYVNEGRLRVLAVMAEERDPLVPSTPTFEEKGFDVVYSGFRILVAPKGTPEEVLDILGRALRLASNDPEFRAWSEQAAIGTRWRDASDTRAYIQEMSAKVGALMTQLGMR